VSDTFFVLDRRIEFKGGSADGLKMSLPRMTRLVWEDEPDIQEFGPDAASQTRHDVSRYVRTGEKKADGTEVWVQRGPSPD